MMGTLRGITFFDSVRTSNVPIVSLLLRRDPGLENARFRRKDAPATLDWAGSPVEAWEMVAPDDRSGDTALHFAVFHGQTDLAQTLLDAGADVTAPDHDGHSTLELAAWEGGCDVLEVLLEAFPDEARSERGTAAVATAARHRAWDRCDRLLRAGVIADLPTQAMLGLTDALETALDADPSQLAAKDRQGRSLLDLAVEYDRRESARALIVRGARLEGRHAAGLGLLDELKRLVISGACVLNPTDGGETPLIAAARHGHVAVIRWLLEYGADVSHGQTEADHRILPIHVAAPEAVAPLVAAGADLSIPYRGWTPLERALRTRNVRLIQALRIAGATE